MDGEVAVLGLSSPRDGKTSPRHPSFSSSLLYYHGCILVNSRVYFLLSFMGPVLSAVIVSRVLEPYPTVRPGPGDAHHAMSSPGQVFLLPLADDGSPDVPGGYIYLPPPSDPPYILRFVIEGSSSICRKGALWVNIPEDGEVFDRSRFRSLGQGSLSMMDSASVADES